MSADKTMMIQALFTGGLFLLLLLVLWRRRHPAPAAVSEVDPQLKVIHDYLNVTLTTLLEQMSKKLEDHLEDEYGETEYLLTEQLAHQAALATNFTNYVTDVSGYPGFAYYISNSTGAEEDQTEWVLRLQMSDVEYKDYVIPFCNLATLIDRLEQLNLNNSKMVTMIQATQ